MRVNEFKLFVIGKKALEKILQIVFKRNYTFHELLLWFLVLESNERLLLRGSLSMQRERKKSIERWKSLPLHLFNGLSDGEEYVSESI